MRICSFNNGRVNKVTLALIVFATHYYPGILAIACKLYIRNNIIKRGFVDHCIYKVQGIANISHLDLCCLLLNTLKDCRPK